MTLHLERGSFHPGETALHTLLHIPTRPNPTSTGLPANYARRVAASPLVALGTLDGEGRPWTTVWGGETGFAMPLQHGVLAAQTAVDAQHDPVARILFGADSDNGKLSESAYHITQDQLERGEGKPMAGLSIDLATRDRVKLAGRLVAGKAELVADGTGAVANVQMAMLVEESLGNCPKYLNKRTIRPHVPGPELVSAALPVPPEALALLARADLFFLSSTDGRTMDTNHRGGPPGFVRVLCNAAEHHGGTQLVYPEYSGNRLYQTLGNLYVRPRVGICVPDFETGDVLYLTGETTTLVGADAARVLPHTKLAVRIRVVAARFVRNGLAFRGSEERVEFSPYNPPVRRLAAEGREAAGAGADGAGPVAVATLVAREILTPSIARFTFKFESRDGQEVSWKAGQHVTLDFSEELDVGWSHMRDDDPVSLNDDFVRTFTVSSVPPRDREESQFQITVRRHGAATGLLWRWNLRVPLEVPLLGFGGEEEHRFLDDDDGNTAMFVAGGVGITPALAQAPGLLASKRAFKILWSLRREDVGFAEDIFRRVNGLAENMVLFIGAGEENEAERLRAFGAEVVTRRVDRQFLLQAGENQKRKYYLCAGSAMSKDVLKWLEGENVVHESFDY